MSLVGAFASRLKVFVSAWLLILLVWFTKGFCCWQFLNPLSSSWKLITWFQCFDSDFWFQCLIPIFDSNVWFQCLIPMFWYQSQIFLQKWLQVTCEVTAPWKAKPPPYMIETEWCIVSMCIAACALGWFDQKTCPHQNRKVSPSELCNIHWPYKWPSCPCPRARDNRGSKDLN